MTTEQRFWSKVQKSKKCWNWTGSQRRKGSYKRGNFRPGGMAEKVTVSRFSWMIHFGEIPKGMCVLHKCDNGLCVRPTHLFLGTLADNVADMDKKGRRKTTLGYPGLKGSANPMAKLNATTVKKIRLEYSNGVLSTNDLAIIFRVSQGTVSGIILRKTWKHI